MKRLVTLIAVAALLGTVAVSYAQTPAAEEDTLILTATVAPYGAIWFGDEDEDDDSLVFDFDTTAVENGTAATQQATLHFRANYSTQLGLQAKAPTMTFGSYPFYASLVTDVVLTDGVIVGGSHDGKPLASFLGNDLLPGDTDYEPGLPVAWSLWPGQVSATNTGPITLLTKNLAPWMKNGMDMNFSVTVKPEIYRWDVGADKSGTMETAGWAIVGGSPGEPTEWRATGTPETTMAIYSGDVYDNPDGQGEYKGFLKATLTSLNP